ncbi:hypothetical protein CLV31_11661 [Algoriphagus aquaeductus]|uniref:Antitoxin n=1 Tax=Algoriphagus aquaeductus TaxID=475299 RepID=A0A326RNS3_9BACT|nr:MULTISPECIES: hypothetical protein [Algoriphagus]PZV78632.1 hypothetical protein CLV31_11661 [Algoriphagus aquaeductus]
MATLTVNNKILEKYLSVLEGFDKSSKKTIIEKLSKSLEDKAIKTDLESLFGAWEDEKSSDEIIKEIRDSRVEKSEKLSFE